jgi:signal transduction histidine kinase
VLEGKLDDKHRKHLRTVRNSAKDLHNLLNDILDVAKLEEGKVKLENAPFSVQNVVDHVVRTYEMGAKNKGIQIVQRISPSLPQRFLGDSLRLKQILMNLMGNALKFTDSGSITVAVEQLETDKLQFTIRDTGIGIAKDKRATIFDNFSQADNSISRKYGGTGLGTTISKNLVELMGGEIWLDSTIGIGSTFYFTIKKILMTTHYIKGLICSIIISRKLPCSISVHTNKGTCIITRNACNHITILNTINYCITLHFIFA